MKKSNITRISKKVFNFPTEASLALQLNKSLPSLAEFLDVCSSNPQYREFARELKDGPPSTTQNLKHRPHTKAPTKRLALLQDAYSDRNIKKHHHTVDTIDGSSLEASVNSPQKMREVLKKSGQGKNLGTGSNSKDSDCVKSSQLSKLALSKILGRTNQKSYWDKENREGPDMYDSQIDAGLESREETEEDPGRDPMKKAFKRLVKDRKKEDNSRSDNSKQKSKLRRSKLAFNDQALGERIALNSSQPHTTKHGSFSVLNSAGSPLYKPTINLTRRNTRVLMSQTRFPATTKHQKANNSLQVEHSQPQSKEREKEKHKKTYSISNSGTVPNSCSTLPKSSGSFIMKEAPKGHKKRGSILSKPQSDTDREAFMPFSTEHPRGLYQRVMTEKAVKLNGSGCEVLLSEPTTRHGEDSEQGSGQLFHGRQGEKFRWREEDTGRGLGSMDLESFARLEIAFGAFLEEHLRRFKGQISQEKMGKIVGSWNAFVNTLDVTEKEKDEEKENIENKGEDAKKKRTPSEPGVKPRKEARSAGKVGTASQKKGRVSTSPNHISLLTGGKSFESKKASIAGDKSIDDFFMEKDKLQQIIQGQQNMIKTLKQNEDKMLKLLSAISRKGYDIEKVYREEIQAPEEEEMKQQQEQNVTDKLKEEDEKNEIEDSHITEEGIVSVLPEDSLLGESMDIPTPDMRSLKVAKNLSDTKSTTDSTPFPTGGTISHKRINSLLKHKLKLDLTGINPHANKVIVAGNGPMISKLNFGPIKENQQEGKEQRPGFHEEFMSKIEEFSLSWRQAAMNQRNF